MTFSKKIGLQQCKHHVEQPFFESNHLNKKNCFKAFIRSEDGNYTIETLIWLPIYVFILFLILNVSMIFFTQSQLLRVVQDSNRSFSVGRMTTLTAVEQYVIEKIAYLGATPTVTSQLVDGIIYTDLRMQATDLIPFSILHKFFAETTISVSAQQVVEF